MKMNLELLKSTSLFRRTVPRWKLGLTGTGLVCQASDWSSNRNQYSLDWEFLPCVWYWFPVAPITFSRRTVAVVKLTVDLATFPRWVMFLLCFSFAMRILCLATILFSSLPSCFVVFAALVLGLPTLSSSLWCFWDDWELPSLVYVLKKMKPRPLFATGTVDSHVKLLCVKIIVPVRYFKLKHVIPLTSRIWSDAFQISEQYWILLVQVNFMFLRN